MWAKVTGAAVAMALMGAAPAAADQPQGPYAPWDGSNPFNCTIQDVGTGTDFPDPAADPFCVEFDKTQQNVTDLGIVDFLANEPARTAAALDKCFYFQTDHWTGSIVQGESPELRQRIIGLRERLVGRLELMYAPELSTLSESERRHLLIVLEALVDVESWARMQEFFGLSFDEACAAWTQAIDRLLPPTPLAA